MSPSLRGRGLKSSSNRRNCCWNGVALFTRAWIEMLVISIYLRQFPVALFTRAWIEIRISTYEKCPYQCRPLYEGVDWNNYIVLKQYKLFKSPSLRGRGLKFEIVDVQSDTVIVALFTRAWIEIKAYKKHYLRWGSPSLRGRGLKLLY